MMMGSLVSHNTFDPRYMNPAMPILNYHTNQPYMPQVPHYENQGAYQGYYQQPEANLPMSHSNESYGNNTSPYYSQNYPAGYQQNLNYPVPISPYQGHYQAPMSIPSANQFNPFENPLKLQQGTSYGPNKVQGQMPANPYPTQNFMQKQQTPGFSSILNQFKTQDGSVDINKMMSTAGQMMNTMNQVSSIVKGFGGLFKATT